MYHDIMAPDGVRASGFAGKAADAYKLEVEVFESHLEAIATAALVAPTLVTGGTSSQATYITFDDGGSGASRYAAPALERRGWRGHFLIATDYIGRPGFMSEDELRELRRRGHVLGTHSASHPLRMARCSRQELRREWAGSTERLSQIIGEGVTVASVPGGMYSTAVAEEAGAAGIRHLFNSEPLTTVRKVGACAVLGRYAMRRHTDSAYVRSLAAAKVAPRIREFLLWNLKKAAKTFGGDLYWRYREDR
jgi:peptidoglycan/xylan/chitin deacetylase (PgdA/CDA1 family)